MQILEIFTPLTDFHLSSCPAIGATDSVDFCDAS